ncbi:UNVERIFIED_CONTAM: signal transduction histidine kinase [Acetivibrio alkalicellulosi]
METYIVLTIISIFMPIILIVFIRKSFDKKKRYINFVKLMLFIIIWSFFSIFEALKPLGINITFAKLTYLGTSFVPVVWFLFSLEYSKKHEILPKKRIYLLYVVPIISLVLVFTNEFHGLFWSNVYLLEDLKGFEIYKYERGFGYYLNLIYSYSLIIAGCIIIFFELKRKKRPWEFYIVILGVFAPFLINFLYLLRMLNFDYTPAAFSITCICFAFAIIKGFFERKMAIVETIHEKMEEGVILIDDKYKIAGINPSAKKILGLNMYVEEMDAKEVIIFWDKLEANLKINANEFFEIEIENKWYATHVYFVKKENIITGWFVTLFDITDKKKNEEALKQMYMLLSATAKATGVLLHGIDYRDSIYKALGVIGDAAKVDVICLYENKQDEETGDSLAHRIYEWYSKSNSSFKENTINNKINFKDAPDIFSYLKKGEDFELVNAIENKVIQEIFKCNKMASVYFVPLFVREEFWGFVAFENCEKEILWTLAEKLVFKSFITSVSRSIERGIVGKELQEEKTAAEVANVEKGFFLANMSHEIRTPLNGIVGFAELLMDTPLNKEQMNYLNEMRNASDSLLYLINNVLDFSKIEAGKFDLENINFNIHSVIEDSVLLISPKALKKDIQVHSEIRGGVPSEVKGDPQRLRQVMNNIVGNAVKFTEKGEIIVEIEKTNETKDCVSVKIEVSDTGIGIPKEILNNLFKPFTQGDISTTRKYGGTGLGLAISKGIIKLMDGELLVESKENIGTKFIIQLTLEKGDSNEKIKYDEIKNLKILLVDDNTTNRRIFKEYLEEAGGFVIEKKDVNEALEYIEIKTEPQIDVALIDFEVSKVDILEFEHRIKKIKNETKTKIIMLTSSAKRGDGRKALEYGFKGYLAKPARKKELLDIISAVSGCNNNEQNLITRHVIREDNFRQNKCILLVEDTDANRKLVSIMTKKMGFECETAVNGKEAVEACEIKKYDLIIMDCQMPIMDGYTASKLIKTKSVKNKETPIMAMTANALEGDREKCIEAGMDEYLPKPITKDKLDEAIRKCLK